MKSISKSELYKPAVILASILAMGFICFFFYKIVVKYLQWKSSTFSKESFIDEIFDNDSNVGIISMMKSPKNIDTWLQKHRDIGIQHFYIRLEETPELEEYLSNQKDVTLKIGTSAGINEYDLIQERQNTWVNECLKTAEKDNKNIKWLFHIDSDEILRGDLSELKKLPEETRTFWIQNEEAKFDKVPSKTDNCFNAKKLMNCSERSSNCVSYGNGKSCGRVASDVTCNGPHRMKSKKEKKSAKLDSIFVEHYESCDFDTYKQKFKRLAANDKKMKIPFSYYNESIEAIKKNDENELYKIYEKYRVINN